MHRGLDPYPEDKDANRQGGSAGAPEKGNEVLIMNAKNDDRTTSFFSQPGILAGNKHSNTRRFPQIIGQLMICEKFVAVWLSYK